MPSILNIKQSHTEYFSGNGSKVAFDLTYNPVLVNEVVVDEVTLDSASYTISNKTITFTTTPSKDTNNICIKYVSYSELPLIQGKDGKDAKSVYQIASENGFVGDENSFNKKLGSIGNTNVSVFDGTNSGLVPESDGDSGKYLSADGTFKTISIPDALPTGSTRQVIINNGNGWVAANLIVTQNTEPDSATTLFWVDTTEDNTLKYHNGTSWTSVVAGAIPVLDSNPETLEEGQVWITKE